MTDLFEYCDALSGFTFLHSHTEKAVPTDFVLHNHNNMCELLIFLKGDATFRVEGTTYYPEAWDIIITNPNEMHKMCLSCETDYERFVANINDSFFLKSDCADFKDMFHSRALGTNNLIKSDDATREVVLRLCRYIKENAPSIVIKSAFIELLYGIKSNAALPREPLSTQAHIKDVILYINENIRTELDLTKIAEHFFINKYHLCHIFRRHTGLSVNRYINYKRLLLARELCSQGMSLTDASEEAGFCNYSSFYKVYKREFGSSPRTDLKKK